MPDFLIMWHGMRRGGGLNFEKMDCLSGKSCGGVDMQSHDGDGGRII